MTEPTNKKPLVSIPLAAFNGASYISQQISSILCQSVANFELIIIDDCSTDGTCEIVKNYLSDPRITLSVNTTNLGYKRNFEKAIKKCKGEFIALADQDDIWHPDKLAILLDNIASNDLIHSDAELIDGDNNIIDSSFSRYSSKSLDTSPRNILLNGSVTGCTCMFRADILKVVLPFPTGDFVHDRWVSLVASFGGGIIYLDSPLIQYRQHTCNVSGASSSSWSFLKVKNAIFETSRVEGIMQHYSFASHVRQSFTERLFPNADLDQAHKFSTAIRSGHIRQFLRYSYNLRDAIYVGLPTHLRILKFFNLFKIVVLKRLNNDS